MIEVKLTKDPQFPIKITLNSGEIKFTEKAAFELLEKLSKTLSTLISNHFKTGEIING